MYCSLGQKKYGLFPCFSVFILKIFIERLFSYIVNDTNCKPSGHISIYTVHNKKSILIFFISKYNGWFLKNALKYDVTVKNYVNIIKHAFSSLFSTCVSVSDTYIICQFLVLRHPLWVPKITPSVRDAEPIHTWWLHQRMHWAPGCCHVKTADMLPPWHVPSRSDADIAQSECATPSPSRPASQMPASRSLCWMTCTTPHPPSSWSCPAQQHIQIQFEPWLAFLLMMRSLRISQMK